MGLEIRQRCISNYLQMTVVHLPKCFSVSKSQKNSITNFRLRLGIAKIKRLFKLLSSKKIYNQSNPGST